VPDSFDRPFTLVSWASLLLLSHMSSKEDVPAVLPWVSYLYGLTKAAGTLCIPISVPRWNCFLVAVPNTNMDLLVAELQGVENLVCIIR